MALEEACAEAHHGARESETEHRKAHDEGAEMHPAPDRKDAHERNLERDHRTRDERHRQIDKSGKPAIRGRAARHVSHDAALFLQTPLWVPLMTSPSSLVKGTKGTILPL